MMNFRTNSMNNLVFILFIASISLFSCSRKKDTIGPDVLIASSNFNVESFQFNSYNSDFQQGTASNWFSGAFNEKVNWTIKISGTQSKAYKIISGASDGLNQYNSSWYGTHTNVYFFKEGEKVIAELSVYGSAKTWVDTSVIVKEIKDYGPDAIIWANMDTAKAKKLGVNNGGWFAYGSPVEALIVKFYDNLPQFNDPVEGMYRSMESRGLQWNYGGFGQGEAKAGFSGASLDEVYLNFYVRKRTFNTKSMSISINSKMPKNFNGRTVYIYSGLTYTYVFPTTGSDSHDMVPDGFVGSDANGLMGWHLVSVKLSDMTVPDADKAKPTFDPSRIVAISGGGFGLNEGFDMDFVVFTRGVPFDQIK